MKLPKITKRSVVVASAIVAVTFSGGVAVFAFHQAPEQPHAATEVKTDAKKAKKEEKSATSGQTPSEVQATGQTDQSAAIPASNRPGVHSGRDTETRRPVAQPQPSTVASSRSAARRAHSVHQQTGNAWQSGIVCWHSRPVSVL